MKKVLVVCICLLGAATTGTIAQTQNSAKVESGKSSLDKPKVEEEPFSLLSLSDFKDQLTTYCRKDNTCKKNIRKIRTIKTCDQLQTFLDVNAVLIVDNDDQKGTVRDVVECDDGKDKPAVFTKDAKR